MKGASQNRVGFDLHLCPALGAYGQLYEELVSGDLMLPNLHGGHSPADFRCDALECCVNPSQRGRTILKRQVNQIDVHR